MSNKTKTKTDYNEEISAAWQEFSSTMQGLRKEQLEIVKKFVEKLTEQQIKKIKKKINI